MTFAGRLGGDCEVILYTETGGEERERTDCKRREKKMLKIEGVVYFIAAKNRLFFFFFFFFFFFCEEV